jgi:predicted nucleotidyltransferase
LRRSLAYGSIDTMTHATDLVKAISEVLRTENGVAAAYLYGSVARSEETALSDTDLALVISPGSDEHERGVIVRRLLVQLARQAPGRSFDVRFLDELPAAIAGRVMNDGELVYERDAAARVRAEVAARMAYHDFLYTERATLREGLEGLRRRLGDG